MGETKGNSVDDETDMKSRLDLFNYGRSINDLIDRYNLQSATNLKPYTPNEIIRDEFKYVLNTVNELNEKNGFNWHLGTVSSGAHTGNFISSYGLKSYGLNICEKDLDGWNPGHVMFVYECPGNNLDACMAAKNHDREKLINYLLNLENNNDIDSLFNDLCCKTLWHADCGKTQYFGAEIGNGNFLEFGESKKYSEFLLQLIMGFKLANFYTTNLFRYEVYTTDDNGKEESLNLNKILWPKGKDTTYFEKLSILNPNMTVFKKELEIVKPDIIFATSNVHWNIYQFFKCNPDLVMPKIVKVPHPASYLSSKDRYLENTFRIIKGLGEAKVITEEFAYEKIEQAYDGINLEKDVERYKEYKPSQWLLEQIKSVIK